MIDSSDYFIIDHNFATVLPAMPTEPNTLTAFASRDANGVAMMTLNWVPPTDVQDIDGYGIWLSTDGGETFNFLASVSDPNATSYQHTGLTDGTKYTYRIRAHSSTGGYSMTSNKTWAVTNEPGPGEDLPTISNITATSFTLGWNDNSSNEAGFEIDVTDPAGNVTPYYAPAQAGTGTASFDVTGLTPNTAYQVKVRAYTAAQVSAWSPSVGVTTLLPQVTLDLAGPSTVNEGSDYSLDLNLGGDDTGYVDSLNVDWGDGNNDTLDGGASGATHTYADGDASETVTVTAKYGSSTVATAALALTVKDVAPMLTVSGDAQTPVNQDYTIELGSRDPGTDTISSWDIDWGDGTAHTSTPTHQYTAPGTYSILATATDEDGAHPADALEVKVYHPGELNTSFGISGTALLPPTGPIGVAVQPDGKVVVLSMYDDLRLQRFMPDGQPDPTFGDDGIVHLSIGGATRGGLVQDGMGHLVVAGIYSDTNLHWAVARFTPDGVADASFGDRGIAIADLGPSITQGALMDVAVDRNSDVLLVGASAPVGNSRADLGIVRFLSNGQIDTSFGSNGLVSDADAYYGYCLGVENDGSIIASVDQFPDGHEAFYRYLADGTRDATFGNGGAALVDGAAFPFVVQPGGRIIVPTATSAGYSLAGLMPNGQIDESFATDGILTYPQFTFASSMQRDRLACQADGKIVVEADHLSSGAWNPAIARFTADGKVDQTFGSGGIAHDEAAGEPDGWLGGIALTPSGSIVVANETNQHLELAEYLTDPLLSLTAHRTGRKLGQTVSESDKDSKDPKDFLILTNNDAEEGAPDGLPDYYDDHAVIPPTSGSLSGEDARASFDDDLARITLHKIGPFLNDNKGTLSIELSNPNTVRLFTGDCSELYAAGDPSENLQLDLSDPQASGYLAGLRNGDVDVWLEGLTKDSDFTFALVLKDEQGHELARDEVHMTIAEWTFVGKDGTEINSVANFPEEDLVELSENDPDSATPDDSQYYKIRIDGLPSDAVQQLRVASEDWPDDFYDDDLVTDSGRSESSDFALLYSSGISGELLTAEERDTIKSSLLLNAVHNKAATATATTKSGDVQKRDLSKLNPKDKAHAILDEAEAMHSDKLYYAPSGINAPFPFLHWGVDQVDVAQSKNVGGSNGASAQYHDIKDQLVIGMNPSWNDVVHETVHAVDDKRDWYITTWATHNKAEALAYGTEWLLAAVQNGPLSLAGMETRTFSTSAEAQQQWNAAWQQIQNSTIGVQFAYTDFMGKESRAMTSADVIDIGAKLGLVFSASKLLPLYNQMLQSKDLPANSLNNSFTFTLDAAFK